MNIHRFPIIEALESRIAPAGIVAVTYDAATGILGLAGDGDANDVSVTKTGSNAYRIEGLNGTGIDTIGVAIRDIGKVTGLTFNGGDGADTFSLSGLKTLKTLTVNGDGGDDIFNVTDVVVKESATFDFGADGGAANFAGLVSFSKDLTVNYGANGGSVTAVSGAFAVGGALILNGGGGDDSADFMGTSTAIAKGITFTAGAGSNSLTMGAALTKVGKSLSGKSVQFEGGTGGDTLRISGAVSSFLGTVEFVAGSGGNLFEATGAKPTVGGELKMTADGGADTFLWDTAKGSIKGPVTIALGDGDNVASVLGASVALGNSLTVSGGGASDQLFLGTPLGADVIAVKGAVVVTQGELQNTVTVSGKSLSLGAGLTVTGGGGDDTLDLASATTKIKGTLEMTAGGGANYLFAAGDLFAIGGEFRVTAGDDGNIFQIAPTKLTVGGIVSVTTGAGDDDVRLGDMLIDMKNTVTVSTGDGSDAVTIAGAGSLKGDALFDLGDGSTGSQFLDLMGGPGVRDTLKFGGKLTVLAATTGVGNEETVGLANVSVSKAVLMTLGAADSLLTIDNLFTSDLVTINTGAGADRIDIEQRDLLGASVFKKAVTIDLGGDNDTFLAGISSAKASNSFAKFYGDLTVDGGSETDESNDFLNLATNYFATKTVKTRNNFEGPFI